MKPHFFIWSLLLLVVWVSCKDEKGKPLQSSSTPRELTVSKPKAWNSLCFEQGKGNFSKIVQSTFLAIENGKTIAKRGLGTKIITSFDAYGNAKEILFFNSQKAFQTKTVFETDKNGRWTRSVTTNQAGKKINESRFVFDTQGILMKEMEMDALGKLTNEIHFKWDASMRLIFSEKRTAQNSTELKSVFKTFEKDFATKMSYEYPLKKLQVNCERTYLDFDTKGNWTRATERTSKGGFFLYEREITYF